VYSNFLFGNITLKWWLFDTYSTVIVVTVVSIKQQRPDLLKLPYLQTQGGSPSKSKCVAFLYQHEETAVMEVVRAAVVAHGKTVLASIHDAIVTKEKLGVELLSEIEQLMRAQTGNRYWRLGAKQLKRYASAKPNP